MKKDTFVLKACGVAFGVNLILFFVKLYIGLRTNSISIYSDAVNNMFDSLSGILTLISLYLIIKNSGASLAGTVKKSEQLFSFLMSLIITLAGFAFLYSSLERFMYPTPVWYTTLYAIVLSGTAAVKIVLFFIFGLFQKKSTSPVIKVMKYDCILDFFITLITIITLVISKSGTYSVDAFFGVIISLIIIVSAIKLVIKSGKILVDYVSYETRDDIDDILNKYEITPLSISYTNDGDTIICYISVEEINTENIIKAKAECLENNGVQLMLLSL